MATSAGGLVVAAGHFEKRPTQSFDEIIDAEELVVQEMAAAVSEPSDLSTQLIKSYSISIERTNGIGQRLKRQMNMARVAGSTAVRLGELRDPSGQSTRSREVEKCSPQDS